MPSIVGENADVSRSQGSDLNVEFGDPPRCHRIWLEIGGAPAMPTIWDAITYRAAEQRHDLAAVIYTSVFFRRRCGRGGVSSRRSLAPLGALRHSSGFGASSSSCAISRGRSTETVFQTSSRSTSSYS